MRLLFVSSLYPPYELGGYEQLCHEVTAELSTRGHDVRVLTSRYGVKSSRDIYVGNVSRSLYLMADIHYYKPLDFFFKRNRQEAKNLAELKDAVNRFQPDIIMFWGMFALSHNLPFWAERCMPGRVVYYLGSYWPLDEDLHASYWKMSTNRTQLDWIKNPFRTVALEQLKREGYPPALKLDNAICCSKYVRDKLAQAGKIAPDAKVIYSCIDPKPFLESEKLPIRKVPGNIYRLLYFGRLVPEKGVHTAIEALGILKKNGHADQLELTILGDGHPDYLKHLRQQAHDLGIENLVHFKGKVPRAEIPHHLTSHNIFLSTSIWPEPFGRTIVEAMLAGLVVLGSDVGGSREIFQYYAEEMLFQPEDAHELANRILRVTRDPALYNNLVKKGMELALNHFTMAPMVDEIEKFLLEASSKVTPNDKLR